MRSLAGEGGYLDIKNFTKSLRQNTTHAENILWYHLRDRRFKNYKFRRQAIIGPYVVDFLCYELNLIIELDGGQHNEGPHHLKDQKRTAYLEHLGYKVLRFWNHELIYHKEEVLEAILRWIE